MTPPRKLIKSVAASFGVQVTRAGSAGRFSAMDACLSRIKDHGFDPKIVIDGGANEGQFFRLAYAIFPDAHYHLIEPQPLCQPALTELVSARPATTELHAVAITAPAASIVRMTGSGTTGAYVAKADETSDFEIAGTTLDELFASRVEPSDRCLLKLDLESHELSALSGARALLESVEAVLVEVSFYDIDDWGRPLFADVMDFMKGAAFELYDIASLSSRPRDERLRLGDALFLRRGTSLLDDRSWE